MQQIRVRRVALVAATVMVIAWTALVHFHVKPFFPIAGAFCAAWIAVSAWAIGGSIKDQLATTLKDVALSAAIGAALFVGTRITLHALCGGMTPGLCSESSRVFASFGPPTVINTAILVLLIGPAEEYFWRGAVLRALRERLGRWPSLLLMSAGCGGVLLVFNEPLLALAALPTSIVWGWLADSRRSLAPAIVSHSTWQLLIFAVFPPA